tara:strand:- start:1979 stop:2437 length:459 start_codon:yes stop_codon:yes gene_type:complete
MRDCPLNGRTLTLRKNFRAGGLRKRDFQRNALFPLTKGDGMKKLIYVAAAGALGLALAACEGETTNVDVGTPAAEEEVVVEEDTGEELEEAGNEVEEAADEVAAEADELGDETEAAVDDAMTDTDDDGVVDGVDTDDDGDGVADADDPDKQD